MNFFLDTEFHERSKPSKFLRLTIDKTPTVELISIGITTGKDSYYAISKDFDLKAAWENKWLRENVLSSIHNELCKKVGSYGKMYHYNLFEPFTLKSMRNLINWYGKSNTTIASDIINFVYSALSVGLSGNIPSDPNEFREKFPIDFYGYYSGYDWVVFCQLFGRMIDLPKGFPMYMRDLKQMMDERNLSKEWKQENCPDPLNEHNALVDAEWNMKLFNEINKL